jgi:hypothetical protein
MKKVEIFSLMTVLSCAILLTSCFTEDPGSLQPQQQQYSIEDFDRVDIGDALHVDVTQGEVFSVAAKGDKRNLDDLSVRKDGTKLLIDFDDDHNRKHDTYITIVMPTLRAVKFSGASDSHVTGFSGGTLLDFSLSGASSSQVDMDADAMNINVSGASNLKFSGKADELDGEISGASEFSAYNLEVVNAHVYVSGASVAKVNVTESLHASAKGASTITYRGAPTVTTNTSGSSSVNQD